MFSVFEVGKIATSGLVDDCKTKTKVQYLVVHLPICFPESTYKVS